MNLFSSLFNYSLLLSRKRKIINIYSGLNVYILLPVYWGVRVIEFMLVPGEWAYLVNDNLFPLSTQWPLIYCRFVMNALKAKEFYRRDVQYIVRNGSAFIINEVFLCHAILENFLFFSCDKASNCKCLIKECNLKNCES